MLVLPLLVTLLNAARVRSTTGSYVFIGVCLLTQGDTPSLARVPPSGPGRGTPIWTCWGTPPLLPHWDLAGVPHIGTWPGYPSCQDLAGVPPVQRWGSPTPRIEQQMEYLIRGGRYACCIHAGGLFCYKCWYYVDPNMRLSPLHSFHQHNFV